MFSTGDEFTALIRGTDVLRLMGILRQNDYPK